MRIKRTKESIDYKDTQAFFNERVKKYKAENPYSVTMYQDNNPKLVEERNRKETEKLLPLLKLDSESKILDVACGIGRWSDAISEEICEYCGIDFCDGFIQKAKERNLDKPNRQFFVGRDTEIDRVLGSEKNGNFNRVLLIGALMYLNDEDVNITLRKIEAACDKNSIICVREPIGLEERLTLKKEFSEELDDDYSVIYRTREELMSYFLDNFISKGFKVAEEGFMFGDARLNNRKETTQYYFVFERKD